MYLGITVLQAFCYLLLCPSVAENEKFPVSRLEGDTTYLFCKRITFTRMYFEALLGNRYENVTSCFRNGTCESYSSGYKSSIEELKESEYKYVAYLRMRLTKKAHVFKCYTDAEGKDSAKPLVYHIYVKPQKPTCDAPAFTSSGEDILVKCRTDQVYPKGRCVFTQKGLAVNLTAPVNYTHSHSPIKSDDVATECEGLIPVSSLPPGQQQFNVTMTADVIKELNKTAISAMTSTVEISLPKIVIAKDCPAGSGVINGLIQNGTAATCTCELIYKGSPPGYAQWYTSDDVAVGTKNRDGSSTVHLEYNRSNPNQNYYCLAISTVKGKLTPLSFSPLFIVKPTCDAPAFTSCGEDILVKCRTDQVYPKARCVFTHKDLPVQLSVPASYTLSPSPIKSDVVSTECLGLIPVSSMSIGQHQFNVTMSADVIKELNKAAISTMTSPVEISPPKTVIAKDCPAGSGVRNGLIQNGTSATCTCKLIYKGSPPGYAQWYTDDDVAVGTRNRDGSSTVHLEYNTSNPNQNYYCLASSTVKGKLTPLRFFPIFIDFKDDEGDNEILVIGLAAALVTVGMILIVVVAVILYRRQKSKAHTGPNQASSDDPTYFNAPSKGTMQATRPSHNEGFQLAEDDPAHFYEETFSCGDYDEVGL